MSSRDKDSKKRNKRNPQPDFVPTDLEDKYGPYRPIKEETPNKFQDTDKGPNRNTNSRKK